MAKKSHKRHGTVRTDLSKRKKPTVAKRVSSEFRSKRVKPTHKERIMAKAHKEYDEADTDVLPTPSIDPPQDLHEVLDRLIAQMELSAQHNAPISPVMIETVKALHDQLP